MMHSTAVAILSAKINKNRVTHTHSTLHSVINVVVDFREFLGYNNVQCQTFQLNQNRTKLGQFQKYKYDMEEKTKI